MSKKQEAFVKYIVENSFESICEEFRSYVGLVRVAKNSAKELAKFNIETLVDFGNRYVMLDCVKDAGYKIVIQPIKKLSDSENRTHPIVHKNESYMILVPIQLVGVK